MGEWWLILSGIEIVWIIGIWLFLSHDRPQPADANAEGMIPPQPSMWQIVLAWGYYLYHFPLLLADYLFSGWWSGLLQGHGGWMVVEAAIIGVITVAAYGTVFTWVLG